VEEFLNEHYREYQQQLSLHSTGISRAMSTTTNFHYNFIDKTKKAKQKI
jgi:hypothetical protein